ncbi:MAG: transporter [Cyclobacteriaceae bacterium]
MNNLYINIAGIVCLLITINNSSFSQGCIAVRSGCGANIGSGALLPKGQWQAGTNFRYFHSYKHFRGTHEETERVELGTEVINNSLFLDFQMAYGLTDRLSLNVVLPFVKHDRSSMYEHGGNPKKDDPATPEDESWEGNRYTTKSAGLADIRFGASYWMLKPESHNKGNFTLGLGVKLPSGAYRAEDTFYNQGDNNDQTISSGVDQSIQPGDGGLGIYIESQGFLSLTDNLTLTGNLYYMSNPRESYTLENRGRIREYSVGDQYAARIGGLYMTPVHGLLFYGGARVEGIPSSDLIGGDEGFRRPGYIVSLEPGVSYGFRNTSFNLTVPIAVERNRVKNFSDKQTGRHGDAAFADYLINFGFSYRFGKANTQIESLPQPIDLKY